MILNSINSFRQKPRMPSIPTQAPRAAHSTQDRRPANSNCPADSAKEDRAVHSNHAAHSNDVGHANHADHSTKPGVTPPARGPANLGQAMSGPGSGPPWPLREDRKLIFGPPSWPWR
jgi:hypothetical protein